MATPADKPPPSLPSKEEGDHAAHRLLPAIDHAKRKQRNQLFAVGFAALSAAAAAFYFGSWNLGLFFLAVFPVYLWDRKEQSERQYMKVALPTALLRLGLEQSPTGKDFNRSLPARLFPRDGATEVSAVFSGTYKSCTVDIAEVRANDPKGETDEALFKGLILRVGLPGSPPDFLILDDAISKQTKRGSSRSWFSDKPDFDFGGLAPCHALPSGVHGLGLWLATPAQLEEPPLAAVLRVLSYPPPIARLEGRIFSATSDGKAIFVALRSDQLPPWAGEITASKDQADYLIHTTTEWLSQPLALAHALIDAAGNAAPKVKGA